MHLLLVPLFFFFPSWGVWFCLSHLYQAAVRWVFPSLPLVSLAMVEWWLLPVFQVCLSHLSSYLASAHVLTQDLCSCLGSFSGQSHCLWLCLHFWRFRPALVHTLACKLVSCSPQCLCVVWCWQSSLWTQLQGEEHWSFLSQFLSKSCHFLVEFQPSSISFATVMVLVAFLSTTSFGAGFSFYILKKNHPALIRKSKSLPLIFRSISRLQPPFLCTKIFFFGNPPHVEFELACLLALFLGVDLPAHL